MLDDMQKVFLANGDLTYTSTIPSSAYIDGTFSADAH
jgi:hypothetical protein